MHAIISEKMYLAALASDSERWFGYGRSRPGYLGLDLNIVRDHGHWPPFTSQEREVNARLVELGVLAHFVLAQPLVEQEHQQSRRVGPPILEQSHVSWIADCFSSLRHLW
jgi:hypothetical protein